MNKKNSSLTIRCFVCNTLVSLIDTSGKPFATGTFKVGDKVGCICSNCLRRMYQTNKAYLEEEKISSSSLKDRSISPAQNKKDDSLLSLLSMWNCLDNSLESYVKLIETKVFGQTDAVRKTALALYNNQFCNLIEYLGSGDVPERELVLLIGPTGVGKTFLAKTAAEAMGIPYAITKAETLTSTGWVGGNVESILEKLYYASGNNIELAERGIVILDEIDKKAKVKSHNERDINGQDVQQELLKILEPSEVWILHNTVKFDTSKLTVMLSGAFVGLKDIIMRRVSPKHIGFSNDEELNEYWLNMVEPEDLVEYGFIEEFVGRAPKPIVLKPLELDTILDIIYAKLMQQNVIFQSKQFKLSVSPIVLNEIAYRVMSHNTGARDIKKEINALLFNAKYKLYNALSDGECIIDENGNTTVLYKDKKTGNPVISEYPGPEYLKCNEI